MDEVHILLYIKNENGVFFWESMISPSDQIENLCQQKAKEILREAKIHLNFPNLIHFNQRNIL